MGAGQLWLGLAIDGQAELAPRLLVTSVPYALACERAVLADDVDCLACVSAPEVAFGYAGSAQAGGPAADLECSSACVGTTELDNAAVTSAKLADRAVTFAKLTSCPAGQLLRATASGWECSAGLSSSGSTVTVTGSLNSSGTLAAGGVFSADPASAVVQTSRDVKEFSGRIVGPGNWPECTDPAKIVTLGRLTTGPSQTFIDVTVYGSHRGYDRAGYYELKRWVLLAGDKVSSNPVEAVGSGGTLALFNGSTTGEYANIDLAAGFDVRLSVGPHCGSTFHYTYVVRYYAGANFVPHSQRDW